MVEQPTCERCGSLLMNYGSVGWDCSSAKCLQDELKRRLREMASEDQKKKRLADAAPSMAEALRVGFDCLARRAKPEDQEVLRQMHDALLLAKGEKGDG